MRQWNLTTEDPLELSISADARCGSTDYYNDQIWRLSLQGGEPPALALNTTFGLRARKMSLFPCFTEGENALINPETFSKPPIIHRFYPNYIALSYAPFTGIDVQSEYWVPESHAVAGRISINNSRLNQRHIRLEWIGLLQPTGDGQVITPTEIQAVTVLTGSSGGLRPVIFMTNGPRGSTGPYPALTLDLELPPGGRHQIIWSHAALQEEEASFNLARHIASHHWDAEIARLDVLNASQVDIETGNPDWDASFAMSQKTAYSLLMGPTPHLPFPSFVLSRHPDQGHSPRGDGSDYDHLWNGQTGMESLHLAGYLLPADPDLAIGLLSNFLSTQTDDGFVDWKPGLGGQRGKMLATPLLTNLAWEIYQITGDTDFLADVFPKLLDFLQSWFSPKQDRDRDGIPEWEHPIQLGLDEQPLFTISDTCSQGVEITSSESPALCAMLYNECQILIQMAHLIERTNPVSSLQGLANNLKSRVESSWDDGNSTYKYWDRDSHLSNSGLLLGERKGSGEINLHKDLDIPARIVIHLHPANENPQETKIFLHGRGPSNNHLVERLSNNQIRWFLQKGFITSKRVFSRLERVEIFNIETDDYVKIKTVDFSRQDQSLLLPLWAGIPNDDRAKKLIKNTITNPERFWRIFGIPTDPESQPDLQDKPDPHIQISWNGFVGEGLLKYGHIETAVELVTRLMAAVSANLKRNQGFRQNYHGATGLGVGERNSLVGLAPQKLFLDTLGVQIISPKRVVLIGLNPFPWPVTLRYRGLTITREKEKTTIIFPGGQRALVRNQKHQVVTLKN